MGSNESGAEATPRGVLASRRSTSLVRSDARRSREEAASASYVKITSLFLRGASSGFDLQRCHVIRQFFRSFVVFDAVFLDHVFDGSRHTHRVVFQVSDRHVAAVAKYAPHLVGFVVVVDERLGACVVELLCAYLALVLRFLA